MHLLSNNFIFKIEIMKKVKVFIKKNIKDGGTSRKVIIKEFDDINSLHDFLNNYFTCMSDLSKDYKDRIISYEFKLQCFSGNSLSEEITRDITIQKSEHQRYIDELIFNLSQFAMQHLRSEVASSREFKRVR